MQKPIEAEIDLLELRLDPGFKLISRELILDVKGPLAERNRVDKFSESAHLLSLTLHIGSSRDRNDQFYLLPSWKVREPDSRQVILNNAPTGAKARGALAGVQ